VEQQQKHQEDADGHDDRQPPHRPLLVLKLTAPGHGIAGWQLNLCADRSLHVPDYAAHIAVADEHRDGGHSHSRTPADVDSAAPDADVGDRVKRNFQAVRCIHEDIPDDFDVLTLLAPHSNDHAELLFTLPDLRRLFATQGGLDDILDVARLETIARSLFP